jgi:hypothetical protein
MNASLAEEFGRARGDAVAITRLLARHASVALATAGKGYVVAQAINAGRVGIG